MQSFKDLLIKKENETLEFKKAENSFNYKDLMEYITAIANEKGGKLILGVDNQRKIIGTKAVNDLEGMKHKVYADVKSSQKLRVNIDELFEESKRIVVINIPSRSIGQPISYNGRFLMRSGESLVNMDTLTLKTILQEVEEDFSSKTNEQTTISDINIEALELLKKLLSKKSNNEHYLSMPGEEILNDLGLIQNGVITNAALILLANKDVLKKYLPNAEVLWEYRNNISNIEYQDRAVFNDPFLLQFDDLWNKVDSRNEVCHLQEGFIVRDIKLFNEQVIRESILNAIAHRDYTDPASVLIKQFPEKIEIISPGGFLPGITSENIIETPSRPRNRLIIDILEKVGLVERSGQGVDKIFRSTIAEGKGLPDYSQSDNYFVYLSIDAVIKDKKFISYIEKITKEAQVILTVRDLVTLEKIKSSGKVPMNNRNVLRKLIDNNIIERASNKYILSKRYYEDTNKRGVYTRRRGLDKRTNLVLIINHLKHHKKGYIEDFVDVLKDVPKSTINKYLRELAKLGHIELVGNKNISRGANRAYWKLTN